jgi:hypothetical protein
MSRGLRFLLLLAACLVGLPLIGWGIGTGRLWAIGGGLIVGLACFYFSLRSLTCSKCGYAIRVISAPATHCMKCGAPYESGN